MSVVNRGTLATTSAAMAMNQVLLCICMRSCPSLSPVRAICNSSVNVDIIAIMHVVLYEPDIPGNTGNVGRSCVATGSTLHLVGRLGFSLDDTHVRRSGLDYWEKVPLFKHKDWETFVRTLPETAAL